jgi:hypothetical protein
VRVHHTHEKSSYNGAAGEVRMVVLLTLLRASLIQGEMLANLRVTGDIPHWRPPGLQVRMWRHRQ